MTRLEGYRATRASSGVSTNFVGIGLEKAERRLLATLTKRRLERIPRRLPFTQPWERDPPN